MESLENTFQKTFQSEKSLDKEEFCPNCGDYTVKRLKTPEESIFLFGEYMYCPVVCKCKQKENRKTDKEMKEKEEKSKLERLLGASMMNKKLQNMSFDNWNTELVSSSFLNMCKAYCDNWDEIKKENYGMFIYGGVGGGKTFMTACISNNLINKNVPVAYVNPIDLINRIYNTYGTNGESESMIINSLNNAHLLIIDDLGAEATRNKGKEIMYQVLDNRLRLGKPLIITSNFNINELKNKLDYDGIGRSVDRILEMCSPIKVENESIRQRKNRNKRQEFMDLLKN